MSALIAAINFPPIDPVIVRLGPLALRWYGLAYLLGFVAAFAVLRWRATRGLLRVSRDDISDLISWLVAGVLIGGRLGWWLFYHRHSGAAEPWYAPLAIWNGGMSFHGGLVGVATGLALWTYRRGKPFGNVADSLALVAPIGLFFGRLANFINAELVGRPTDLPWGVVFPGEQFGRHPSQLYEAVLEGPILLLAIWWIARRTQQGRHDGWLAGAFLVLYGIFRFGVEFTRQPDDQLGFIAFGWLTMGQLLSIGLAIAGAVIATARVRPEIFRTPRFLME